MPKLSDAGTTRKISIYQIIETGNVRADYTDIEDLAASIKKNTLLEPILVKTAGPVDGDPRYELIAGHRRLLAHKWLCEHGDDFSMIEAKIVTGDKLTLQLVENLQRSDLSAKDRERAIFQMSEIPGMTQRDIAAQLSKTEFYISRQISAYKVRKIAEEAGHDTSTLETSVMSEIQTAAKKDIPMLISYILNGGGTVAAAKSIMRDYRPPKRETPPEPAKPESEEEDPLCETNKTPPENDIDPLKGNIKTSGKRGMEIKTENPEAWKREPIQHKQVDLNEVFNEIYAYLTALEKKIKDLGPDVKQAEIEGYKKEAALDIISLVQKRFED
jgi:ParB/RepB/Spo0J family partition protein